MPACPTRRSSSITYRYIYKQFQYKQKKKIKGRSDSWKIKAHFKCYSNETKPQKIGVNLTFSKVYYNLQWEL